MNKKIMILILGIMLIGNVMAISGVSPGSYKIDFEPNLEKEFVFDFTIDKGKVDVFVEGELKDLVELDKDEIWGRQVVTARLILPAKIDNPGINQILIKAGDVTGIIKINVPYPNEFVELSLNAPDVNVGGYVDLELNVLNKGKAVNVMPRFEIYKVSDSVGEIISIINIDETFVESFEDFYLRLDTANYSSGNYFVLAVVEFGDEVFSVKNSFRLGEKRVDILSITRDIKENKVVKFEVEVASFWNNDIKKLYAEIKVKDSDYSFVTTSVSLGAWEKKTLSGFFDASQIYGFEKDLEIILYYDGSETVQEFPIEIIKGFDYILAIVIIFSLIIISILVWRGKLLFHDINKIREGKNEK